MFQVFVSIWSICKYFTLFPYNRIPYQTQLPVFRDQHSLLPVLQRFRGLNPELYQVWCHTIRTPTNGAISLQGSRLWCFSSVGLVLFGSKRDNERKGALGLAGTSGFFSNSLKGSCSRVEEDGETKGRTGAKSSFGDLLRHSTRCVLLLWRMLTALLDIVRYSHQVQYCQQVHHKYIFLNT